MRKSMLKLALLTVLLAPAAGMAMDDAPAMSPEHDAGKKAVEAKNWDSALKALTAAEKKDPANADVQNLLGYAYRNSGKLDLAFRHYERALQINPRHLGTHEYVGEAYLMTNNLPKAEEHLAALKKYCARACEERDDLEKAIASYRQRGAGTK
jgi:Flp pilus assembly protein TadD